MENVTLASCVCLGSAGYPISAGISCHIVFSDTAVAVHANREVSFMVPMLELCSIDITGPGSVTSGGGFIGGGFGVEGALQGMAIAAVLNAVTTKSKIHTFITMITNVGELHFHYSGMEPSALRIALAGTFTTIRKQDPNWQETRLAVLQSERKYRGLSDLDFERLSSRVVQPLSATANASPVGPLSDTLSEPLGKCPNCDSIIPLYSEECPKCQALFGLGSAWKLIPL